jgi:methylenetetrahydrofolate reductase (NADPH)
VASVIFEVVPLPSVEQAIAALPPASRVSVTCSPVEGVKATVAVTDRIRGLGHRAVPHLAARMIESHSHLTSIASWLRTEAIDEIIVVAGDAEVPLGPYPDAMTFLHDLLAAGPGVATVGVPAYPDNHPLIDTAELDQTLLAKQALLADAGVRGYAATQMCFSGTKINDWLHTKRAQGMTLPIHLGVPGVVERSELMATGVRLGVIASLRYLRKNRATVSRLLASSAFDPGALINEVTMILEPYGVTGIHCFTFNQVEATAQWQKATLGS